ncbi:MAG: hypothetical protein MK033_04680 [Candidatus Caenarcaniphilales bacterium]|nr:hypothetical protein [Candidatus Caenarcaniphilales bacterium]
MNGTIVPQLHKQEISKLTLRLLDNLSRISNVKDFGGILESYKEVHKQTGNFADINISKLRDKKDKFNPKNIIKLLEVNGLISEEDATSKVAQEKVNQENKKNTSNKRNPTPENLHGQAHIKTKAQQ